MRTFCRWSAHVRSFVHSFIHSSVPIDRPTDRRPLWEMMKFEFWFQEQNMGLINRKGMNNFPTSILRFTSVIPFSISEVEEKSESLLIRLTDLCLTCSDSSFPFITPLDFEMDILNEKTDVFQRRAVIPIALFCEICSMHIVA
jgi:hypothetical protein